MFSTGYNNYSSHYEPSDIDFDYEGYEQYETIQNKMIEDGFERKESCNTTVMRNRSSDFQLYRGHSEEVKHKFDVEKANFNTNANMHIENNSNENVNSNVEYAGQDESINIENESENKNNGYENKGFNDENTEESNYNFPDNFN